MTILNLPSQAPTDVRHLVHVPRRFTRNAWGGTEQVLAASLPFEAAAGYQTRIMTTRALDAEPRDQVGTTPVSRHRYLYPEFPLADARRTHYDHKGGNLVSFDLARQMAALPNLDLVHLHTGNRLGAQALRVARKRGAKVLITLHGGHFAIPALEEAHLRGDHLPAKGIEWGRLLSAFWRTRRLLDRVDGVICVGLDEYEAAKKALPHQRVYFLPGGIDPEPHAMADAAAGRALLGLDDADSAGAAGERRPLVVCVARLDAQKDQETLVRAWAALDTPCDLALVGPETTLGYADQCRMRQRMTSGKRPPGRLIIPGGVDPSQIPNVLAAADLAVLPSQHEPFGLACVEAWASGTPLIASRVGGPAELLADPRFGRLFRPGDHKALQAQLTELLADPAERQRLGQAGRNRALADYTWASRSKRLLAIYDEVMDGDRNHSSGNVMPQIRMAS